MQRRPWMIHTAATLGAGLFLPRLRAQGNASAS